ncbi:MAG: D-glycero-beta-D-manno-heptose 1,7-bisphosphate 7-phosphatase [Pseudomonadota bacterium]
MTTRLVILDRDGVINQDSPDYIKNPDEWQPIPGSLEAIARLKAAGWTVAVATNQSGIARGYFDEATLAAMHAKMDTRLRELGGSVDLIRYCPHGPGDGCDCRKPRAGLYHQIGDYFGVSLQGVPIVGDSLRDLEPAAALGARPILVLTGKGADARTQGGLPPGTRIFDDLAAAADELLKEAASGVGPLPEGTDDGGG